MVIQPSLTVQLEDAHGPLTAQQSKTILAGLEKNGADTNIFGDFLNNQEINAAVLGQYFRAQMQALFEKDLKSSKLVTFKAWRKRSIGACLKERAARLWAHWL